MTGEFNKRMVPLGPGAIPNMFMPTSKVTKVAMDKTTGIGLPDIALLVLLLPAVNCQCKTKSGFKFTIKGLPVYVCLW